MSFSAAGPHVIVVPGSVEQRGTDLSLALSGSASFCRPVTAHDGSSSFLLTAQLGAVEVEGVGADERLVLRLAPAVGSKGAEAALAEAAGTAAAAAAVVAGTAGPVETAGPAPAAAANGAATSAAAPAAAPAAAAPMPQSPTPAAAAAASEAGMELGKLQLPRLRGLDADAQGHVVQSVAVLALSCCADLLRHEGGVPGLKSMLAGGLQLLPCGSSAPGDAGGWGGGWRVRGRLPEAAAAVVARSPGGGLAAGASAQGHPLPEAGYWEYPYDATSSDVSDHGSEDGQGDMAGAAGAGGRSGREDGGSGSRSGVQQQPGECDDIFDMDGEVNGEGVAVGVQGSAPQAPASGMQQQKQPVVRRVITPEPEWVNAEPSHPSTSTSTGTGGHTQQHQAPATSNGAAAAAPGQPYANGVVVADASNHSTCSTSSSNGGNAANQMPAPAVIGADVTAAGAANIPADTSEQQPSASTVAGASSSSTPSTLPPHAAGPYHSQPLDIKSGAATAISSHAGPTTPSQHQQQQPPALGTTPGSVPKGSSLSKRTFSRAATKRYSVQVPPRVLMLHLKRFQADAKGRLTKIDTQVSLVQIVCSLYARRRTSV